MNRLNSSVVEQWTENPCVGGSNPPLDNLLNLLAKIFMKLIKLKPNTSGTSISSIYKNLLSKNNRI